MHIITKPNGHPCTVGEYVRSWRILKTQPPNRSIANWDYFPEAAGKILRDISYGVQDRINRRLPWWGRGRKWHHDWQRTMLQSAHAVNQPRLRIHWLPPELKPRFAHRLATLND